MTSTFYLARGPAGSERFYQPAAGADPWVGERDQAFRFECRNDARHVAEMLMLVRGDAVATVATGPSAPLDRLAGEVQCQEHAGSLRAGPGPNRARLDATIAGLHEAGALTRANVAAVNAAVQG